MAIGWPELYCRQSMDLPTHGHDPVLMNQVLEMLSPQPGQTVVDCTLGRGGHSSEIARRLGPEGLLIGLDVDPNNLEYAKHRLEGIPCRIRLFHANFAELEDVLELVGLKQVDGILADLGLSTNQFLDPAYGLSFDRASDLDMRIDPRIEQTAADLIARLGENDLANVLYELAQERFSRRIARKIVEERKLSPIKTTERLADIVRQAYPSRGHAPEKIDPATRTFMALRMRVNQELENLGSLLNKAPGFLAESGRLAVISFHSMEDRAVKQAFRSAEQTGQLKVLTPKPLSPTDEEVAANPRSRSAKLRVAQRVNNRNVPWASP